MRKEEGKVRERMTDEKREMKTSEDGEGGKERKNRDNGRRERKCFMITVKSHLTNTPEKRPSTTLRTLCLETWPMVGESQMSLAQKAGCFWDSPMHTLRA